MLINQSLTPATLGLFSKQPEHPGQSANEIVSAKMQDRGTFYGPSQPNTLGGVYADPRLRVRIEQTRSAITTKVFDALTSFQNNEFKVLEAGFHRAVQAEIGRELNAGERLSIEEWQSMSADLRRSGAEVNLLRVQLAVANGEFDYAGSIGFAGGNAPQNATNALNDMANFRALQVQNLLTKMTDATLATKLGGQLAFETQHIGPLSDSELKILRKDIFSEMLAQHKRS